VGAVIRRTGLLNSPDARVLPGNAELQSGMSLPFWERQLLSWHVLGFWEVIAVERKQGGIARLRGLPKSARWLPRDNTHGHRGVSALSFCDGAIRFYSSGLLDFISIARLRGLPKSARWLPRDNPRGHRGVSALSSRDGAIRFLKGRKRGSRGRKNHLPRDNLLSLALPLFSYFLLKHVHPVRYEELFPGSRVTVLGVGRE